MVKISYILMILGGITGYFGGIILKKIFKKQVNEKNILFLKLTGFLLVLAGVIILFKN